MIDVALGIDIGTSGVRICATDVASQMHAMATAPLPSPSSVNGRMQQDATLWWKAVQDAFANLSLNGMRVRAIAVDGTSGTILPINDTGIPTALASMYNDTAPVSCVQNITKQAPETSAARGATSPLARAFDYERSSRLLHQADWISGKLSGVFAVSDENNALKTGYDPIARVWPAWIEATGFSILRLPKVVPAGTAIGTILPTIAGEFGLPADTVIVLGTTDGCAAFLASGASQAGDGVTSLGTTLTIKILSATPVFAPEFGIYSHRIGDQWLAGGASNTGGAALKAHFSEDEIKQLSLQLRPDEPTGLDYYPLPRPGERFPVNDPNFEPRLEPYVSDQRVYFQAMLEGIATIEEQGYSKLAQLGASTLASVRSLGGGAANAAWTQIRMAKLRVPTQVPLSEHAAVGTARLAWRGIGHEN